MPDFEQLKYVALLDGCSRPALTASSRLGLLNQPEQLRLVDERDVAPAGELGRLVSETARCDHKAAGRPLAAMTP